MQAEFFLFVGLAVAMGLALFLAMVVWGMYRSNRLVRIKNRLRRPTSTQPTPQTTSDVIDAYLHSPPVSPAHMGGGGSASSANAIDLEQLEIEEGGFKPETTDPLIHRGHAHHSPPARMNSTSSTTTTTSTLQQLGVTPVPNTYGNGSYVYGTLGRQQNRPNSRPLSITDNSRYQYTKNTHIHCLSISIPIYIVLKRYMIFIHSNFILP